MVLFFKERAGYWYLYWAMGGRRGLDVVLFISSLHFAFATPYTELKLSFSHVDDLKMRVYMGVWAFGGWFFWIT
jgi:hypothetical protein